MNQPVRPRAPVKEGFFTVPANPEEAPRFLATRCDDCGEHFFPRRVICGKCMSEQTSDVELAGGGTLFSYTFVHFPLFGSTNVKHQGGYGVGQVDLPEGPRIQAPLAGKQEEFQIGQNVTAELDLLREDGERDLMIFRFRPLEAIQ